jgi:hypothetical protein
MCGVKSDKWIVGHVCAQPATSWTTVVLTSRWCTQETSETRRVSAVVTNGGGEVPRASETASASSRASCESVGEGGSGVSAARRAAASCCLARCSCTSFSSRGRGAGNGMLSRRRRGTAGATVGGSRIQQNTADCARQHVLHRRDGHCAFLVCGQVLGGALAAGIGVEGCVGA